MTRVLAIEDDAVFGHHLQQHLAQQGYHVVLCSKGCEGLKRAESGNFDVILLDILLPGLGGIDVLNQLRQYQAVPVILISALGTERDRIRGFRSGADDYLPKPFSMGELEVRIEAVLRRVAYERQRPEEPTFPSLHFDSQQRDVRLGKEWAGLTQTEYRLLEVLGLHVGEVLTKAFLYQEVLHRGYAQHDRGLDMHVSNLRGKLAKIRVATVRIEAVWGKGYILTEPEAEC